MHLALESVRHPRRAAVRTRAPVQRPITFKSVDRSCYWLSGNPAPAEFALMGPPQRTLHLPQAFELTDPHFTVRKNSPNFQFSSKRFYIAG